MPSARRGGGRARSLGVETPAGAALRKAQAGLGDFEGLLAQSRSKALPSDEAPKAALLEQPSATARRSVSDLLRARMARSRGAGLDTRSRAEQALSKESGRPRPDNDEMTLG